MGNICDRPKYDTADGNFNIGQGNISEEDLRNFMDREN